MLIKNIIYLASNHPSIHRMLKCSPLGLAICGLIVTFTRQECIHKNTLLFNKQSLVVLRVPVKKVWNLFPMVLKKPLISFHSWCRWPWTREQSFPIFSLYIFTLSKDHFEKCSNYIEIDLILETYSFFSIFFLIDFFVVFVEVKDFDFQQKIFLICDLCMWALPKYSCF